MPIEKRIRYQQLIKIAIPAVLESLFSVIISTIDTKMIAVLGSGAISAIAFTTHPQLLVFSIFFSLGTTLSVFVAQSYGEKNREKANNYLHAILKLTILLSLVLGVICVIFAYPIMNICSQQKDTLDISVVFFKITMGGMIFRMVSVVLNGALRGIGKTNVTLFSNIAAGVIDIIFNYLLIEGHLGFPAMGVAGDALATVIGSVAACGISLFFVIKKTDFLSLHHLFRGKIFHSVAERKLIVSKAGNMVLEKIFTRIGFLLNNIIISTLPTDNTAVYFVGMILLNYSFAFGDGIESAVVALAGRSMGENDYAGVKAYIKNAHVIAMICSCALCALYILGAQWFFGLYFDDGYLIREGQIIAAIAGGICIVQLARFVDIAGFRATGEMKIPRRIATVCILFLNPGASYIFTIVFSMDIWGIWLANSITQIAWFIVAMILSRKYFKQLGISKEPS